MRMEEEEEEGLSLFVIQAQMRIHQRASGTTPNGIGER